MKDTYLKSSVYGDCLSGFKEVITRELQRILAKPLYILMTIVLPLTSFLIFWIIFSSGVPNNLPITIYDADNSQTSRQITRMLDSAVLLKVAQKTTNLEEGKRLILRGDSNALIVLPKNMEKDIFHIHPAFKAALELDCS